MCERWGEEESLRKNRDNVTGSAVCRGCVDKRRSGKKSMSHFTDGRNVT